MPVCRVARTALIIPLEASSAEREAADLASELLAGEAWHRCAPPSEVEELSPILRDLLDEQRNLFRRLRLSPPPLEAHFGALHLVDELEHPLPGRITQVELLLWPLGIGLLVISLDLTPARATESVATVIRSLRLSRRLTHRAHRPNGWRRAGALTTLAQEVEALLQGSPFRLAGRGSAWVHTSVLLEHAPPPEDLHEHLFRLRRAYDLDYPVPPQDPPGDRVFRPRRNRAVGISREGVAVLHWLGDGANEAFEHSWPERFQGIYLLLALLIHAERRTLERLETMAAAAVDQAVRVMRPGNRAGAHAELIRARDHLKELAGRMVHFTASMSTDDCGGQTEIAELFSALRQVSGINERRQELRADLRDLLALADTAYNEVYERLKKEEADRERDDGVAERRFQRVVAAVGAGAVPTAACTGLFGMNNDSLPADWPWWGLVLAMTAGSLVLSALVWRQFPDRTPVDGRRIREVGDAAAPGTIGYFSSRR
jgi:hypothetical protein